MSHYVAERSNALVTTPVAGLDVKRGPVALPTSSCNRSRARTSESLREQPPLPWREPPIRMKSRSISSVSSRECDLLSARSDAPRKLVPRSGSGSARTSTTNAGYGGAWAAARPSKSTKPVAPAWKATFWSGWASAAVRREAHGRVTKDDASSRTTRRLCCNALIFIDGYVDYKPSDCNESARFPPGRWNHTC